MMAYTGGRTEAMDTFGRRPEHQRFGQEARDGREMSAHHEWCQEFETLFGSERRGLALEEVTRLRAA
jgi:tRNA C32,U32 (ribose-2'-O)-methylase TrmJ